MTVREHLWSQEKEAHSRGTDYIPRTGVDQELVDIPLLAETAAVFGQVGLALRAHRGRCGLLGYSRPASSKPTSFCWLTIGLGATAK
jgi:hypothetical protein